jgi:3-oxoadipate enol-lactonase
MWDVNVPALAAGHRLILWEPRGHARSESPEDPARVSFARWTLDLKDVLDHLGVRRAHVGGLSLGAGIATRFTLRFPGRVRSLLVTNSSSASGLPLSVDNLVMRAQSIKITLERGMDAMAEFALQANPNLVERLRIDPASREEFYEEYRKLTPIGYANSLRALLAMDHHRAAASDPAAGPPHRRRSRPLARAHEGHASQDPRLQARGPLSGQPLRQSRPAPGVDRAALQFLARVDGGRRTPGKK